jgi:Holliday junction DNA helicase RuvA
MSVSGIGPKTALGILSTAPVSSLQRAIAAGEASVLTRTFGIGKKNAERLVVELRDKIIVVAQKGDVAPGGDTEILEALVSLGYSTGESRKALQSVGGDVSGMRERLASALRNLGSSPL